jgi:hypothetical protein
MEIVIRYVLDRCEIEQTWKTINVRSKAQKWVVSNGQELLVETFSSLHRVVLEPGDWEGADKWGVREYANVAWTQNVIDAWNVKISSQTQV